jgi:cellulose synthase (UDP-forming)
MDLLDNLAPSLMIIGLAALLIPKLDPNGRLARLVGASVIGLLLARYMIWRTLYTLPAPKSLIQTVASYGYFAIEMLSCLGGLITLHVFSRTVNRSEESTIAAARMAVGDWPRIDMFIATYNESREIVERTIVGALSQDYPSFRVWVLDDGKRPWLADLARKFGAGYLTRPDGKHAKAGNLNSGLRHVLSLPDPPDAISVIDADFVATPLLLRRAASLFHQPDVAVVQTPQYFFNPDPIQLNLGAAKLVPDEQRFFFDAILPSKDAHGTAFSCGTSSIVRIGPLLEAGGFPTESVTEDLLLSVKMKSLGYRTVYLNEPLSFGLAPEGLGEYLTQRGRWCLGTMQIIRSKWGPFTLARMPWMMRLHTVDNLLFWTTTSAIRIASLLVPLLYWWFGIVVMDTNAADIASHFGPFWISSVIFLAWISRGTHLPLLVEAMALLSSMEQLKASAIGLFGSRNQKFKVTAKGASRQHTVVHWSLIRWFAPLAALTAGGMALRVFGGSLEGTDMNMEAMNVFWSFYNIAVLLLAIAICVERPRPRGQERFAIDEPAALMLPSGIVPARLVDASLDGARLALRGIDHADIALGGKLFVDIATVGVVAASVARMEGGFCSVRFDLTHTEEVAMIRKLFSGNYARPLTTMDPVRFIRLLAARALG